MPAFPPPSHFSAAPTTHRLCMHLPRNSAGQSEYECGDHSNGSGYGLEQLCVRDCASQLLLG